VKVPKDQTAGALRIEVRFDSGPLRGELTARKNLTVVSSSR
jgi:hypothetical protein